MSESWSTRLERWKFNLFPAYRGTGGRVTHISRDWSEVRITVPLSWRTRNYVASRREVVKTGLMSACFNSDFWNSYRFGNTMRLLHSTILSTTEVLCPYSDV